ncbi:UDP-glucuronic acid decarboxylase family protein [Streptomyces phyllanthi]|uniref:SDR family oxidoreductase n=1 Tax=Streptomyces phyllanthi TaxID=1803180 RepID=A0A5N8W540_9ACTN|nr:UDP-glucuronic acid decarboxylase family protein [Streptomyces phyllanthi]MPY41434.1 SDR family oxidoreductase [Streptomyces phyllanthi]
MRVVVTGGAGFLGSHLCESLMLRGDSVVCLDDLSTGRRGNVEHLLRKPGFEFFAVDVSGEFEVEGPVDAVAHLASPASPPDYLRLALETLAVGSRGTEHALRLADRHGARFVLASTSEVYGDPLVHPQGEGYWGNVNPVGPRSVYDEAKRFAEALTTAYRNKRGVNAGILRIFNTYGPRMRPEDGRVVSNFIRQALAGKPLTIYGDGKQTRSFCYVDDLVRGILAMLDSAEPGPINLGNPDERSMEELAGLVLRLTGSESGIEYLPLPEDDPVRRRPLTSLAQERLAWSPQVTVEEGLRRTVDWFGSLPQQVLLDPRCANDFPRPAEAPRPQPIGNLAGAH